jgi:hypothetical protein
MVESKTKLVFIDRLCVELVQNLSELSYTIKIHYTKNNEEITPHITLNNKI